jgi:hypothetical protein
MASASSIVGSLQVNITASTAGIQKAFASTQKMIGGFVNKASLVGAGVAAAFGGMLKTFESNGAQLEELSQATGIAVGELAFLKYAATQSGAGIEELTKAARGLITKGIDPGRFEEIANSIAAIKDPTMRAQSAMYYFGKKSALALLPLINDLPKLRERFEQLGGGFTGKMATAAKAMGDAWGNVELVLSNVTNHIAFALAPTITKLSEYIADNGKEIVQWIDDHSTLILIIGGTAAALTLLSPALVGLSAAINIGSAAVTGLNFAMGLLAANPVMLWVIGISAAIVGVIALLEHFFGLWTKFKAAIGMGPSIAAPPNIGATPNLANGIAQGIAMPSGSINPSGNTVDPSSSKNSDSMVALMKTMNDHLAKIAGDNQQTPTPMAPVVISAAGIR